MKDREDLIVAFLESYKHMHMLFWKALSEAMSSNNELSPGLYAVLMHVDSSGKLSQGQIAGMLKQSDAAISKKITQLQKQGLVRTEILTTNRRKIQVSLTDEGIALRNDVHSQVIRLMSDLLRGVSDDVLNSMISNNTFLESHVQQSLEKIREGKHDKK